MLRRTTAAVMMSNTDLHSQVASIMEVLANAAVAEICRLLDDGWSGLQLEVTQSRRENEGLRRKNKLLELQVARYRAEGSIHGRFPGVRVGSPFHGRTRFLNRVRQSVQKPVPIVLDQDPDQEVVTTTKTEAPDAEEEQEICIVKVEGASQHGSTNTEVAPDISSMLEASPTVTATPPQNHVQPTPPRLDMEVSDSDFVDKISESDPSRVSNHDFVESGCGRSESCFRDSETGSSNIVSDVIVIDEYPSSDKQRRDSGSKVADGESPGQTNGASLWSVARSRSTHQDSPATYSLSTTTSSRVFTDAIPRADRSLFPGEQPGHNSNQTNSQTGDAEKTFSCPICRKCFLLDSDLHKHLSRHTRQKPYTCLVCSKSFVCQSQLDMHHNVHTGARPFSCAVCGRRFSHPSNLRRHLKIQHPTQRHLP